MKSKEEIEQRIKLWENRIIECENCNRHDVAEEIYYYALGELIWVLED